MDSNTVALVPHDPNWIEIYKKEAERFTRILGDNLISIHQIGSTVIPGLMAKPIIDFMPVVKSLRLVDNQIDDFIREGFEYRGEFGIPLRRYIQTDDIHAHVYQKESPEIERHLKFRDYLINNPKAKKAYEDMKKGLLNQFSNNRKAYTMSKTDFIYDIDAKAGYDRLRIVEVATNDEKEFAEKHLPSSDKPAYIVFRGGTFLSAFHKESNTYYQPTLYPSLPPSDYAEFEAFLKAWL